MIRVLCLLGLAACYDPSVRDCTVTCEAADDCAAGQVCGAAHYCAAPHAACGEAILAADAGHPADDATDAAKPPIDAPITPPPVDAATGPLATLHLHADGKGIITGPGIACDSSGSQHGDCTLTVLANLPITLHATGESGDAFQRWMGACTGTSATCTVTPAAMPTTDVHAMFAKDH